MNIKALIFRLNGNSKEALKISDIILSEQLKNKTIKKYNLVKTYTIRSRIFVILTKYDEAIRLINNTLKFPKASISKHLKAELFNNLGSAYLLKDNLSEAYYYYDKAYQIKIENNANLYDLSITAFNIGIIHEVQGDLSKAIEFYKKSETYDLKNQGEKVGFISDIYVALSNVYIKKNDLEKAEVYIEKALNLSVSIFGENNLNVANVYSSYVQLLKLKGKYKESLVFDEKSLTIREKSNGLNNQFSIENLMSMAKTYKTIGEYDIAEKKYFEAWKRIKKLNSKLLEANCFIGLGDLYLENGESKKPIYYFDKAHNILSNFFYKNHKYVLEAELLLANALFNNKEYDKALFIIKKHLYSNKNSDYNYPQLLSKAIHINNLIALEKYKKSKKISILKNVYADLEIVLQNVNKTRKEYTSEISIINSNKQHLDYFEKAIEICYTLYKNTKEKQYLEKAFRFSEINRNSTLLSGIRDERFKKIAGIPDSILKNENTLKRHLRGIKRIIYNEKQSVKLDSLMSLRLTYDSRLDSLLQKIEREYPKYYQLKYSDYTVSISDLQRKYLDEKTTLMTYYVGVENVYAFIINENQITFVKFSKPSLIKELVFDFRKKLIKQVNIDNTSKKLFNLLLREYNIKDRLTVVTDDVLSYLPFEILLNGNQYLLENHAVSYSGSATLFQIQRDWQSKKIKKLKWSGFAPKYNNQNSLSSNNEEIENIAKLMKGNAFIGKNASIKNFISQTNNASILHLATHAILDNENPLYSKLIFSEESEKYELTASEIYSLSIKSELVVLSACNTGFGKLERGEGIMSLSRAFHYAGVKSTVMSLWKVPDKETAIIMNYFYENLNKGLSKDKALQKAKLNYLEFNDDSLLQHPYYWAGFVVSGNTDSLSLNRPYWQILLLIIIPIILFYRKRLIKLFN
jgi:tetratricopeptide (TPR) repeat protein